jgi:hypothetical protein
MQGWIFAKNLRAFMELLSFEVGYSFDESDVTAVRHGVAGTDIEQDLWFEYPLVGRVTAEVRIAADPGSSVVHVEIHQPPEVAAFAAVLGRVMDHYWVTREPPPGDGW